MQHYDNGSSGSGGSDPSGTWSAQSAIGDLVSQLVAAIEQQDWQTVLSVALQLVAMGAATILGNGNIKINGTEINGTTGEVVSGGGGAHRDPRDPRDDDRWPYDLHGNGNGSEGISPLVVVGGLALLYLVMQ